MDDSTGPPEPPSGVAGATRGSPDLADQLTVGDRNLWRPVITVSVIVLVSTLIVMFAAGRLFDEQQISTWLTSVRQHWWTPLAFVACYIGAALLLLPVTFLSVAAALVWGWRVGGAIELVAATLAAVVPFAIARGVAPPWLERRLVDRFPRERFREEGMTLLLLLRLIPVIPYVALNYLAGFATFRFRDFLVTTFVGMIPSVFIFAYFVDALAAGLVTQQQVFVRILVAGALLAGLTLLVRLLTPAIRARMRG
ncbi:MAG TPA: VTT domain-containing protein [Thermoanaerobaculia bacterium]|nr:VTT domain-containing protein [Thermoanaerobaculia bacterium]